MPDIGGPEWLDLQRARLDAVEVDPALALVVEASVTDGTAEPVVWHLVVADGDVALSDGGHETPDLRLTADAETISAIVDGRTAAARAFLDGRLRVEGDLTMLRAARDAPGARPPTT